VVMDRFMIVEHRAGQLPVPAQSAELTVRAWLGCSEPAGFTYPA
jgi:hypothetical protein